MSLTEAEHLHTIKRNSLISLLDILLGTMRILKQLQTRLPIRSKTVKVIQGSMLMEKRILKQLKMRLPIMSMLLLQVFRRMTLILKQLQTRLPILRMTAQVILGMKLRKK